LASVARRLDQTAARRRTQRLAAGQTEREATRNEREARYMERQPAPSQRDLNTLRALADQLGRDMPDVRTRAATRAAIKQWTQVAAVLRDRRT
jgi:hypothetical protein